MLKKFLIGTFVALALLVGGVASAAYDFGPTTLKVGSTGVFVSTLQSFVGAIADGSFGPMTKAKVMVWQAANGLTADGVFGPMSKAKANAESVGVGTWPSGCSSNTGYSITTGLSCSTSTAYPAGCNSTVGYSPTTGAKCDGATTGGSTGPLTGGAGTLDLTTTTTSVEGTATEGKANVKVLGFKAEASDSDIALTNVKLVLKNCENGCSSAATTSEKLADYLDSVKVMMGTTEVGSADAADFTRESATPDTYTKSIALSGAVIKEGDKNTFWVEVSSGSIDTEDLDALWNVDVVSIRYTDATGVVLSDDSMAGDLDKTFSYESSSANDNIAVKTDTANPDASSVEVKTNDSVNDVLIGAFKLKTDTDSSDIKLLEIPVVVTVASGGNNADAADNIISALNVKIDGTSYEADLSTDTLDNGSGAATYILDLNDSDVVVAAGDTVEVKIYVDLNEQENNYASGTTLVASVEPNDMDAEGADTLTASEKDGTFTGELQTLELNAVNVALVSDPTLVQSTAGHDAVASTYLAKFIFNVTAPEDYDIYLPADNFTFGTAGTQGVEYTVSNGATVTSAILSSTADKDTGTKTYLVSAGDTEKFTFSVYLTGDNTTNNVAITGIWYAQDTMITPTGDGSGDDGYTITSGLEDFETPSVYLGL
jgi:hypothetical protein